MSTYRPIIGVTIVTMPKGTRECSLEWFRPQVNVFHFAHVFRDVSVILAVLSALRAPVTDSQGAASPGPGHSLSKRPLTTFGIFVSSFFTKMEMKHKRRSTLSWKAHFTRSPVPAGERQSKPSGSLSAILISKSTLSFRLAEAQQSKELFNDSIVWVPNLQHLLNLTCISSLQFYSMQYIPLFLFLFFFALPCNAITIVFPKLFALPVLFWQILF